MIGVMVGLAVVGFFSFVYFMLKACVTMPEDIFDVFPDDDDDSLRAGRVATIHVINGVDGHTPDMFRARGSDEQGWTVRRHRGTETE